MMNLTIEGKRWIYCALCDSHYPAGYYSVHINKGSHRAALADRQAMMRWYRKNGS